MPSLFNRLFGDGESFGRWLKDLGHAWVGMAVAVGLYFGVVNYPG